MEITPNQWDALYDLKEKYALAVDKASNDAESEKAHAAFTAVCEALTILGE
jgi:hypothetical protein